MNTKEFLQYTLFSFDNITLTVTRLIEIIVILVITRFLIWGVKKISRRQVAAGKTDPGSTASVNQIFSYVAWIIAISIILEMIGVKLTLLIAGSAALLVGIGLGLQQIFKDFIGGIILLFDRSLKVSDVVELNEVVGRVLKITLRTTHLETRDNIHLIIPNSKFVESEVINWSYDEKKTRFYIKVGVAYGSDTAKVSELLVQAALMDPKVFREPVPYVLLKDFGDSSLNFELVFWTDQIFRVEFLKSEIRFIIDRLFRENGITIPFPQQDVHIIKD
ncbi:MAG: mechanosensitive ion channel family protein [Bacteroidota bacterium]